MPELPDPIDENIRRSSLDRLVDKILVTDAQHQAVVARLTARIAELEEMLREQIAPVMPGFERMEHLPAPEGATPVRLVTIRKEQK